MSAPLGRLRYFLADAWDEWRHSPGVNVLATATLTLVLFVATLVLLLLGNIGHQLERWRRDVRVQVYLRDDATPGQHEAVRAALLGVPGVVRIEYLDKAGALARFRESFGDLAALAGELGTNPLPASFEVLLPRGREGGPAAHAVVSAASGKPGVEEVRYDREWLDRLDALLGLAGAGGTVLGLVLFGAVSFVMGSVLRLAVLARQDEIDIMLLVGASPRFVRGPFLVAGLAHGLAAAVLSLLLVEVARRAWLTWASERSLPLLQLLAGRGPGPGMVGWVVAVGLGAGLASAFVAVRRI